MIEDDVDQGFRLDGRFVRWGTLLGDFPEASAADHDRSCDIDLRDTSFCGCTLLLANLSAPAPDRPVLGVSYEIAAGRNVGTDLIARITARYGSPATHGHEPSVLGHPEPSSGVVEWASWGIADVTVGVSVYGAPRRTTRGPSVGMLWFSWSERHAAQPFLADWLATSSRLAGLAARAEPPRIFDIGVAQQARAAGYGIEDSRAWLALHARDLRITPEPLARGLGPSQVALWTIPSAGVWCLSTRFDTTEQTIGGRTGVQHHELRPAKGGGATHLHVGSWSIYDYYPSSGIADIAEAVARLPGVNVEHHEGYDC